MLLLRRISLFAAALGAACPAAEKYVTEKGVGWRWPAMRCRNDTIRCGLLLVFDITAR